MTPKLRHRWAVVALSLAACTAPAGLAGKPASRAKASPSSSPKAALAPSAAPQASPATASSPKAQGPSLPIRLGLALPASLVGAAKARLAGEDGRVALEGDRLIALASGQIISNNSGAILSNHTAGLISDQGGGLISDQGGSLISNHGASWRLLDLGVTEDDLFPSDRRFELWERLLIVDLADQLLKAYRLAGPKLGAWVPFTLSPELLEPPSGAELFRNFVAGQIDASQGMPYTGLLQREGAEGLRLWILRLPQAGASPAEGSPAVDLQASGPQAAVARLSSPPELRGVYGIQQGAMRLEHLAGGGLRFEAGDRFLPEAQWTPKQKAIMGHQQPLARRRLGEFTLRPDGHVDVLLSEATTFVLTPQGVAGPWAEVGVAGFGYLPPPQPDPGLATWVRYGAGLLGTPLALGWLQGEAASTAPPTVVVADFLSPDGEAIASPGAALRSLLPAWSPSLEAKIPAIPGVDDNPAAVPHIWPEAPPEGVLRIGP